jgi:hypothetical protein
MAIKQKNQLNRPREIDLTGPEGNAYVLLGYANDYCKQLKRDPKPILEEMKSGDYENLVTVFDREFGSFVDLLR